MKNVILGLLVMVLLMGVVDLAIGNSVEDFLEVHSDREEIVVLPGDSLWSIAREAYDTDDYDMNMVISVLKQVNGLKTSNLAVGQELIIPAKEVK